MSVRHTLLLALTLIAIPPALAADAPAAAVPATAQAAAIQYKNLVPNVIYNTGGEDMIVPAGAEVNLEGNFTAKTDAQGKALVVFGDAAKILLKPNTEAQIGPGTLAIKQGDSWLRFTKRGTEFKIKTPTAVLGIRGTTFQLKVDETGTEVRLLEGMVAIETEKGETMLTAGNAAKIAAKDHAVSTEPVAPAAYEEFKRESAPLELNLQEGGAAPTLLDEKLKQETGVRVDVQKVKELEGLTDELQKE